MAGPVRPSGYIGWASATGATNIVEPIDSKKGLGWANGESPSSSMTNWLLMKQDQGAAYLQWKSNLRTVVVDDFSFVDQAPNNFAFNGGPIGSTNYPKWITDQPWFLPGGFDVAEGAPEAASAAGCFYMKNQLNAYGFPPGLVSRVVSPVGVVGGRDFFMEGIIMEHTRGPSGFGCATEFGVGITGLGGQGYTNLGKQFVGFVWTGASPMVFAQWQPTGQAATSVSLGVSPLYKQFRKYTVESRGPTMAFYVDDQLLAAAPAGPLGASGVRGFFGSRAYITTGVTGNQALIDRMEFAVARAPT